MAIPTLSPDEIFVGIVASEQMRSVLSHLDTLIWVMGMWIDTRDIENDFEAMKLTYVNDMLNDTYTHANKVRKSLEIYDKIYERWKKNA